MLKDKVRKCAVRMFTAQGETSQADPFPHCSDLKPCSLWDKMRKFSSLPCILAFTVIHWDAWKFQLSTQVLHTTSNLQSVWHIQNSLLSGMFLQLMQPVQNFPGWSFRLKQRCQFKLKANWWLCGKCISHGSSPVSVCTDTDLPR